MEGKSDAIRENGMLFLLAVSPIVIGFFYYVAVQLPVIGTIWIYAAPFTVLYYWGWVATVFRSHFRSFLKSIVWMNLLGLVLYVLYIWQYVLVGESAQIPILAMLSQLYTVSLGFITMWIGIFLDKNSSIDAETLSVTATVITETIAVLFMIAASVIGYFTWKDQDETEQKAESEETNEIESIFSDRELEEYELRDEEEAQK